MSLIRFRAVCLVLVALVAGGAGWLCGRHGAAPAGLPGSSRARTILCYQDSMHPWIKSATPGQCPVCGMVLTPVYLGGAEAAGAPGLVTLSQSSVRAARVQTSLVSRRKLIRTVHVTGIMAINEGRHAMVSARYDGVVEKVLLGPFAGEVKQGTPLAIVSGDRVSATEQDYINLTRGSAGDPRADDDADRSRALSVLKKTLLGFGLTEAQIAALPQRLEVDSALEVRAPINGMVISRWAIPGQQIPAGQRMFEMADLSRMWFRFDAYESDMPWLAIGDRVSITPASAPDRTLAAQISFLAPSVGEVSRTIKAWAEVANPPLPDGARTRYLLRERDYAEGVVEIHAPEVLTIPRSAVLSPGGNPRVYLDKGDGTYVSRPVQLGRMGDQLWEVLAGLGDGESVVTNGNALIDSQAEINQAVPPEPVPRGAIPTIASPPGR